MIAEVSVSYFMNIVVNVRILGELEVNIRRLPNQLDDLFRQKGQLKTKREEFYTATIPFTKENLSKPRYAYRVLFRTVGNEVPGRPITAKDDF